MIQNIRNLQWALAQTSIHLLYKRLLSISFPYSISVSSLDNRYPLNDGIGLSCNITRCYFGDRKDILVSNYNARYVTKNPPPFILHKMDLLENDGKIKDL
jgi:hypothetical protein